MKKLRFALPSTGLLLAALSLTGPVWAQGADQRQAQGQLCEAEQSGEVSVEEVSSTTLSGESVAVEVLVMVPPGEGPNPAIVLLHSAMGLNPPECYVRIMRSYREKGYASVLIDHASGANAGRSAEASIFDLIFDLKAAGSALREDPRFDPQRLYAIGWSRGALAVLHAFSSRRGYGEAMEIPFSAAVGFYPTCPLLSEPLRIPVLLIHGSADRIAPVQSCRDLVNAGDPQLSFIEVPGTDHFFDHPDRPEFNADAAEEVKRLVWWHLSKNQRPN